MRKLSSLFASAATFVLFAAGSTPAQEPPYTRTTAEEVAPELGGTLQVTVGPADHQIPYSIGPGLDPASASDDVALYQGDIVLGPLEAVRAVEPGTELQSLADRILFGLVTRNLNARWPEGRLRYMISPDLVQPVRVANAIAAWEAATDAVSFERIEAPDGDYVEFVTGVGCSSPVGKTGGRQFITLAPACDTGNTIHEIGHALGLHHEQAREDRGERVFVRLANIVAGREGNFLQDPETFEDVGHYCYGSIMHYGAYAFSKQPGVLKTIETEPAGIPIGQRSGLADCDVATIETIYGAAADPVPLEFEGELVLFPDGCQAAGKCFLRNDLRFTDPKNVVWMAGKWMEGAEVTVETGTTDGASIPNWAVPVIGDPFSDEYLTAAVLHDHYCYKENHVRSWRDTHRMFYEALKALGVGFPKAEIMYAAVLVGGPKWLELVPGENCGPNCIMDATATNDALEAVAEGTELKRDARFDDPAFADELAVLSEAIEADSGITPEEIVALAQRQRPHDFFFAYPDAYIPSGPDDPVLAVR